MKFILTGFKQRFTLRCGLTLLALVCIALFIHLGNWQIARAHEKEAMFLQQKQQKDLPFVPWTSSSKQPTQYQKLKLRGRYLLEVFLLDNQHYLHQFGYHVLSPFELENGGVVLVDRGWVKGDMARKHLPEIPFSSKTRVVQGEAYFPSRKGITLGPIFEKKSESLGIIEKIDLKLASQILHKSVNPFIIRLEEKAPDGFVRKWPVVSMPPKRHYGYAFQWFAFAGVVLILYVILSIKKKS